MVKERGAKALISRERKDRFEGMTGEQGVSQDTVRHVLKIIDV